jgi:hemerythrin-like metal-binding protein
MTDIKLEIERIERLLLAFEDQKPIICWGPIYYLGNETIDCHHKLIVQYINYLYFLMSNDAHQFSLNSIFDSLKVFASQHFAYEEDIFESENYEHSVEHQAEHSLFITQIESYFHQFQSEEKKILKHVHDYLQGWLSKHILIHDKKYAKSLNWIV